MTIIPIHFCCGPIVLTFLTSPGSSPLRLCAYIPTCIICHGGVNQNIDNGAPPLSKTKISDFPY
jgi:hypothetical protein